MAKIEWIDVEDEMPPEGGRVLAYRDEYEVNGGGFVELVHYWVAGGYCGTGANTPFDMFFSHWAVLPEGPNHG